MNVVLRSACFVSLSSLVLGACEGPPPPPDVPPPTVVAASAPSPSPSLAERLAAAEPEGSRLRLVRTWSAGEVTALDVSIEGGLALVGTREGTVTGWVLPEAQLDRDWRAPPEGEEGPIVAVGLWWSRAWAVWQRGEELWLVDLTTDRQVAKLPLAPAQLSAAAFPREEDWLLLALADGSFARWLPPAEEVEPLEVPPPELDPLGEAARWAAAGLGPDTALGTRESAGLTVSALDGPRRLSADGRTLLAAHDGALFLWHTDALGVRQAWEVSAPVERLEVSPDGRLLAVGAHGSVQIRDAVSGTVLVPALDPGGLGGWEPFGAAEPLALDGYAAAALAPDERALFVARAERPVLERWDPEPLREGRVLDTRLDRMLRAAPVSPDALLARAELASLAGRWNRAADLLAIAEQTGAAVHPADRLRALCLGGRTAGARELLPRISPRLQGDPAVVAWGAWLARQP